ncbi:MAG: TonB-dependent receptor, partial [Alphaproteobacteria bacterium]|nr:TonB-dependent receptor [Alphaproteobacteria bacterium]
TGLAGAVPNLNIVQGRGSSNATNIYIRGIGQPDALQTFDPAVGVYVDGVYYSRIRGTQLDLLDLQRVEVLRGPQGTLYGKNTTAGAINITTRAPSFTWQARGEASVGNLDFRQLKTSVSGPILGDTVAFRLAGSLTKRRGTIFNVTSGRWVNGQDNVGVRGQILVRATPSLDLTLSGDYNRQNPECCAQIYVRTGATQRPLNRQFAALAAAFGYAPPSTDPFDRLTDLDTELRAHQELGGAALRAEYDLGAATLTSVSAFRFWNWDPSNDRDFTGLPITTVSANPSRQQQWTQEFRIASNGKRRLDYVAGLFAFHQTLHTSGLQRQGPAASRWLLGPSGTNPAVLNGLTSENDIDFSNTSVAAFGQLSWRVTDRLRLQPGLRVNYDRKNGSYVATVTNGTGTALTAQQLSQLSPQSYRAKFSDWNVSADFTASFQLSDRVMAYATYARTFKSGGINLSGLPLDAANQPILSAASVKPERVRHYEVGLKTQPLAGRATLNIAGFWTEIGDYQATVTNGQLGVLRGYLANAEKVRVRGVEIDSALRPVRGLSLYFNGAFTDHEYVRFTDAPCPPELSGGTAATAANPPSPPGTPGGFSPANCDISGQWLPGISRWSASWGGEYSAPAGLLGVDGEVFVGYDGSYRSRFSSNPSRSAYTDVNGYSLANFRVGYRWNDGWNLSAWLRNAFDTHYFEVLATQSGSTGLVVGQPGDPRTYGVTLAVRF